MGIIKLNGGRVRRGAKYQGSTPPSLPQLPAGATGATSMSLTYYDDVSEPIPSGSWPFIHAAPNITTDRVVFFLHGLGEDRTPANLSVLVNTSWDNPIKNANDGSLIANYHIIAPQLPSGSTQWNGAQSQFGHIDTWVKANIDSDPQYAVTGYSSGGAGCWRFGNFADEGEFGNIWGYVVVGGYSVHNTPNNYCIRRVHAYHGLSDTTVQFSEGENALNAYNSNLPTGYPAAVMNPSGAGWSPTGKGHSIATEVYNDYYPDDMDYILNINQ